MASKLSQTGEVIFRHPSSLQHVLQQARSRSSSLYTKPSSQLPSPTRIWKFRAQMVQQQPTKQLLVHVVKEGETLSAISKIYGVSVYTIAAANKDITDIDLVFQGQELNIPSSSSPGHTQTKLFTMISSGHFIQRIKSRLTRKRSQSNLCFYSGYLNQKISTMISSRHLPHAKSTGYFLVLVPLVAFCIRCVMGSFHNRVAVELKCQTVKESSDHQEPRSTRWKSALSDIRDPDILDAELGPDPNDIEDEDQSSSEELSHVYTKVEHDYQEFLSQCGMSRWGYWRGGSSN